MATLIKIKHNFFYNYGKTLFRIDHNKAGSLYIYIYIYIKATHNMHSNNNIHYLTS